MKKLRNLGKLLIALISVISLILLLRSPILKAQMGKSEVYYRGPLGFVYTRNTNCGWIGRCSHWDTPVWGIHSITFELLENNKPGCHNALAKTKNAVYYYGKKKHQVADPKTFTLVNTYHAKDSQNVYNLCDLTKVTGETPEKLVSVGVICEKGNTSVYCGGKKVAGADPKTFEHIWRGFYRDAKRVYHLGVPMENLDPKTFKALTWGHVKDINGIYFFDETLKELTKIEGVDTNTFEITQKYYSKDRFNTYFKGERVTDTQEVTAPDF
jgi:hypothetical protein